MKYIIKEANCTIILDSEQGSKGIEHLLRAVACTIMGVEVSDSWDLFGVLMREVNEVMITATKRR